MGEMMATDRERLTRLEVKFENLIDKIDMLFESQEETSEKIRELVDEGLKFRKDFDSVLNKAWGFRIAMAVMIAVFAAAAGIGTYFGSKLVLVASDQVDKVIR